MALDAAGGSPGLGCTGVRGLSGTSGDSDRCPSQQIVAVHVS